MHLHSHAGLSDGMATVHAHIESAPAPIDHDENTTADVDISLTATIKLLNALPWLALVAIVLGFGLSATPVRFSQSSTARPHFLSPPYFAPPGRAPPH